jgi:uncharacterized membrane protein HdeD (DUF308 family)
VHQGVRVAHTRKHAATRAASRGSTEEVHRSMTIASPPDTDAGGGRGWFIALGVVLVILGLIALYNAVDATIVTTIIVGWLLEIAGIANVIGAFTTNIGTGWRIVQALLGILYVIVGFNIAADPLAGAIALTIVVGVMLIADGVFRLVATLMDRPANSVWMIILAIVNILFGIWVWTNIPISGVVIGVFVGVQLLVAGIAWIVAGFMGYSKSEQPVGA